MFYPILFAVIVFVATLWLLWDMLSEGLIVVPFVCAGLTWFFSWVIILSDQRFQPKIIQSESYKIVVWNDGKKENTMLLPATNSLYYVPENLLEVDGHGQLIMKK